MDKIIHLNVGGKRIDTYLRTLLIDKSFIHYEAFKSLTDEECHSELPKDTNGNYFIDDNPDEFSKKLNDLRKLVIKENGSTFKLKTHSSPEDEKHSSDTKKKHHLLDPGWYCEYYIKERGKMALTDALLISIRSPCGPSSL